MKSFLDVSISQRCLSSICSHLKPPSSSQSSVTMLNYQLTSKALSCLIFYELKHKFKYRLFTCLFAATGQFSNGYFTFWAIIAIAWGTIGSAVIIILPLVESWGTIQDVFLGMLTNDRLMERVEEMNIKLQAIITSIPEAQHTYLIEKEKLKKKEASEYPSQSTPNL